MGTSPTTANFLTFTFVRNVFIKYGFLSIYMSNCLQFKRGDGLLVIMRFDKAADSGVRFTIGYLRRRICMGKAKIFEVIINRCITNGEYCSGRVT